MATEVLDSKDLSAPAGISLSCFHCGSLSLDLMSISPSTEDGIGNYTIVCRNCGHKAHIQETWTDAEDKPSEPFPGIVLGVIAIDT